MRYFIAVLVIAASVLAGGDRASAQPALSVRIMAPASGATVQNPVRVQVQVGGGTVADATAGDPQALHYHILIDVDPATVIQPGQPLPTGRSEVIHTANLDYPLNELAPGRHTITAILTRGDHVPLSPNIQDQVTFTVAAGQASPAPSTATPGASSPPSGMPRTGTGASGDAALAWPVTALLAIVPVVVAGAAVGLRRRRA